MNMLERFLGHDLATTRDYLQHCQDLPDEALDRVFDIGWGTLRKTFNHMIGNIEVWTDLMRGQPVRSASDACSVAQFLERLEKSYADFASLAQEVEREGRLDALWMDVLDHPPTEKSFGGAIGHVITHNMHHRAEVQHILYRLGMQDVPEGDLMGWDQRQRLSL